MRAKNISGVVLLAIAIGIISFTFLLQGCNKDDYYFTEQTVNKLSKNDYRLAQIKMVVNDKKAEKFSKSFLKKFGLVNWNSAIHYKGIKGEYIKVPIISTNKSKKLALFALPDGSNFRVLVLESNKSSLKSTESARKIYGFGNKGIYRAKLSNLKSADPETICEECLNGSAPIEDLYESLEGEDSTYDPDEQMGTMKLCTNVDENAGITDGHAWIELYDNDGQELGTFSLWGNQGTQEFWVNNEMGETSATSLVTDITYGQMNSILEYNTNPDNTNWEITNTCAEYSMDVWNLVAPDSLDIDAENVFGITTPADLAGEINDINQGKGGETGSGSW